MLKQYDKHGFDSEHIGNKASPDIEKALDLKPKTKPALPRWQAALYRGKGFKYPVWPRVFGGFLSGLCLGLCAAAVWALFIYAVGIEWQKPLSVLSILAVAAGGYGLRWFFKKGSTRLGLVAVIIGLMVLIACKYFLAELVVMSPEQSIFGQKKITKQTVDYILEEPGWMFLVACSDTAKKEEWSDAFAMRVWFNYILEEMFGKQSRAVKLFGSGDEKVASAIQHVNERIADWSVERKRVVVVSRLTDYDESLKEHLDADSRDSLAGAQIKRLILAGEIAHVLDSKRDPSNGFFRQLSVFSTFWNLYDLLLLPFCFWVGYRIGSD